MSVIQELIEWAEALESNPEMSTADIFLASTDNLPADLRRIAAEMEALIHNARAAALEETAWLRRLLRWCRPRLKHPSYQAWLDKYLAAGPSPAPEDEPELIQSTLR